VRIILTLVDSSFTAELILTSAENSKFLFEWIPTLDIITDSSECLNASLVDSNVI
jgi:hypothetical protein